MVRSDLLPTLTHGLPPEPELLDGGSVADVPEFARGFTFRPHILFWRPPLLRLRGISPNATHPLGSRFHNFGPLSEGLSKFKSQNI